jgi:hypothetical protein
LPVQARRKADCPKCGKELGSLTHLRLSQPLLSGLLSLAPAVFLTSEFSRSYHNGLIHLPDERLQAGLAQRGNSSMNTPPKE